jgi:hypothetical protein
MALLVVIILTLPLCLSALKLGAHLAIAVESTIPAIPAFFLHRILDPVGGRHGMWYVARAVFITLWPPGRPFGNVADGNTSWSQEMAGSVL